MNQTLEQRGRVETARRSSSVEVAPLVLLKRHFLWSVSLFLSTSLACGGKKISSNLQHANLSLVRFKDYTIIHPARGAEEENMGWWGVYIKKGKKKKKETGKTVFPLMTLMGRREFCFCFLALGVKVRMSVVLPFHVDASAHSLFFLIDAFGRCVSGEVTWRWDWSLSLKDHWRAEKGEKEVGGYLRKTLPWLWRK